MTDTLRDRFREAGVEPDAATLVVAEWLRDEAGDIEAQHSGEPGRKHVPIVKHLRWLADAATEEGS